MNNLITIKGTAQVDGLKFCDIEGGFGPGKKAMLAKDIAEIHGKDLRLINEAINNNRKRFINGLHIIDLKGTEFEIDLVDHGFYSQNGINRSNNLYALSERGYAILLKILEDDLAWGQYDKLVDSYFNKRTEREAKLSDVAVRAQAMHINAITRQAKLLYQMTGVDTLSKEYKNI